MRNAMVRAAAAVHRWLPDLPVLYVSGYMDDAILRHGISTGEVALLTKPFTAAALARRVREVLEEAAKKD